MKSLVKYILLLFVMLAFTQCYDRDVLGHKDGVSLPEVANLESSLSGDVVTLTWNLPTNITSEVKQPISVRIQIFRGPVREHLITLSNAPTTWQYTLEEPDKSYKAIVKLEGEVKEPEFGKSDLILSLGQAVEIK